MRTIVLVVGFLLLLPLRCATADDIIPLEKYLPKNTNLQTTQSCQNPEQCNQSHTECLNNCRDRSCGYTCCINFRSCMGSHSCNILYIQCFEWLAMSTEVALRAVRREGTRNLTTAISPTVGYENLRKPNARYRFGAVVGDAYARPGARFDFTKRAAAASRAGPRLCPELALPRARSPGAALPRRPVRSSGARRACRRDLNRRASWSRRARDNWRRRCCARCGDWFEVWWLSGAQSR